MRFPDLLIAVKRMEERVRLIEHDLSALRRDLGRVFPEAKLYLGVQPGQSNVDSEGAAATVMPGQMSIEDGE